MKTVVLVSGQMRTADKCAAGILHAFGGGEYIVHAVADDDSHYKVATMDADALVHSDGVRRWGEIADELRNT